jgi:LPXTG-site transpeptidase (sortase) family protein
VTSQLRILWWLERALLATAFVFGLWALLAAAQTHFYASLPVPSGPSAATHLTVLPGEGTNAAHASAADMAAGAHSLRVSPGEWVARLEAPSVGLTATVIEGSSDQMLARAAGHIEETAFPGQPGNVGIAGHRDTTFRAVRGLRVGDTLTLTTVAGVFHYEIEQTLIVDPTDVYVLDPTDRPSLTLVTCYPFTFIGHAPRRYIVRAVQRATADASAGRSW